MITQNEVRRGKAVSYKNKKSAKNGVKVLLIILIVLLTAIFTFGILISKSDQMSPKNVYVSSDKSEILSVPLSNEEQKKVLTVVDNDTQIPKDYKLDLGRFDNIECDKMLINDLSNMICKASQEGINLRLNKGYIDKSEQDMMYNEKVCDIMDKKSYTKVRAGVEARKLIAPGGYSEYQTGLLINFELDSNAGDSTLTKEYMWLNKNAIDYGFIIRYNKDKEKNTGMNFDPSCYRYVGKENAKRMRAMNMCLEEYVDYIASQSFSLA